MGLDFKRWLAEKLGGQVSRIAAEAISGEGFFAISADLSARELAFSSCINLVSSALGKCEFQTFYKGAAQRGEEYYLWNLAPNKNQSSSVFLQGLIARLYRNNEALVIEQGGQLLLADAFCRKEYALFDDLFSQVQVGDFCFSRSFTQSEVLYFSLQERAMRPIVNGMFELYRKLLDYGMSSYQKSRGTKGTLELDAIADAKFKETYEELRSGGFRNFAKAESAILPLYKGMRYTDLGSKTYASEGTRDIRAMLDDVSDFTAKAFGIPPALLRGDVQGVSDALDQFLTFCIDPLADLLAEEINRKRCGKAVLEGTYLKIDTKSIKHVDLLSSSNAIDKLISSGAFCVNEIRALLGEVAIDEPWAWQHFMTKNYSTVQDLLAAMQDGEVLPITKKDGEG